MAKPKVARRLTTIVSVDVAGYSRLMEADEAGTLEQLTAHREHMDAKIGEHGGRIVSTAGDGLLVEFPSVADAVSCALDVQSIMAARNEEVPDDRRMEFRIGVNLGDVMIEGDDIFGNGVNVAARLQALAEPGGICISRPVYDQVRHSLDLGCDDLGPQEVKNITEPVRAYRVLRGSEATGAAPLGTEMPALEFPDKPSIAVLAFDNLSGDPDQEYFADGIAEDIITGVSRNRGVFVIARNSTFTYKGAAVDARQVARELGVRYVLEGSVRKAGSRVRITAQLIDATTGNHVWAERYDRQLEDIFALQDEITQNIVAAIGPELTSAEIQRARRKDPKRLDAWDCTMRATWHFARLTRADIEEARRLAHRAIELDPGAAPGFGVLAFTHLFDAVYGWSESPPRSFSEGYDAAYKAVALDDRDATAYTALGTANWFQRRFEDAVGSLETAIDLDPNYAAAHGLLGGVLAMSGRTDEAAGRLDTAMRLSPRDPFRFWWLAWHGNADFIEERYDEAAERVRKSVQINPDFPGGHRQLAAIYGRMGRIDEARAALDRYLRLAPGQSVETIRTLMPFKRPEDIERYLDGLRKAGLPE